MQSEPSLPESFHAQDLKTFWEHFGELQRYLLIGIGIYAVVVVGTFAFGSDLLVHVLVRPLGNTPLTFFSPIEPFLFRLKLTLDAALVVSIPLWVVLLFSLFTSARTWRRTLPYALVFVSSSMLGLFSVVLAYFYLIPQTLALLRSFAVPGSVSIVSGTSFLSLFLLELLLVFGTFQLPVILGTLSYLRLIDPSVLARRHFNIFVFYLIIFSLIAPTSDVVTLLATIGCAMLFTEIGLAVGKVVYTKGASINAA
jgi:sec-independent protein translocase protein TatC